MNIIIRNQTKSSHPSLYCIKDEKAPGFAAKRAWLLNEHNQDLQLLTAEDEHGKALGFIEYSTAETAWRPVIAPNYLFIHCIAVISKENRNKQVGSALIAACIEQAGIQNKDGVCVSASKGVWMANPSLFLKNGFVQSDARGRFQLMHFSLKPGLPPPSYPDWDAKLPQYQGWHLLYADQCPWHIKSVTELSQTAREAGINLQVTRLNSPAEARQAPMGYGCFGLIKDGVLLEDHYLSATRFKSLLKKHGL